MLGGGSGGDPRDERETAMGIAGQSKADLVLDARAELGEGAIWSHAASVLYWVDIHAGHVHVFDPAAGTDRMLHLERPVGCVAETAAGGLVAALPEGFCALDPSSGALGPPMGPAPGDRGHRFNDGTVDPAGRFIAGTMPLAGASDDDATGTLWAWDGQADRRLMGGLHTPNGLAFSPDGRTAYVSDSYPSVRTVWAFDHDRDDGAWTNRRVFFDTRAVDGRPDGATVDADGCYWMAGVGGAELVRLTPAGRIDMRLPMPVSRPTRPAFGGTDLATLYVTSIRVAGEPGSGGIYALQVPGVMGLPATVMA